MASRPLPSLFFILALILNFGVAQETTCTVTGTHEQVVKGTATDPYTGYPTCLAVNRQPALYTGSFGDCLGGSEMQINRFTAAYYKDNLTLSFDLEGSTDLDNVNTVIYISVYAYGENRFEYTWNPCGSSAQTICPTNNTRPFTSILLIPLGDEDVNGIPPMAFQIPDFEGQAIMRIFNNNTQQEVACYSVAVSNGLTFSHPVAIGTVVGLFVLVAFLASVASAIHGSNIVENRLHYAHSISVWVVFSVLQHVFLTGALSVNWPSVLPAWWSNFAWAAGMIYSPTMQSSLDRFVGADRGNTTFLGAASTGASSDGTGGGYSKPQILAGSTGKREELIGHHRRPALLKDAMRAVEQYQNRKIGNLTKRDDDDVFTYFGSPVTPGLPLPGNYSGFAGTLSGEGIPASNAFMTGILWLVIIVVVLVGAAVAVKWILELLIKAGRVRQDRFSLFRAHWLRFAGQIALRACFGSFFTIMFLTMFQFSYHGSGGSIGIAALVFLVFLLGAFGITGLVFRYKLRYVSVVRGAEGIYFEVRSTVPFVAFVPGDKRTAGTGSSKSLFKLPWIRLECINSDPAYTDSHKDEDFIRMFGWLTARFRSSEWWFFVFWLGYDFVRAIFLGGAAMAIFPLGPDRYDPIPGVHTTSRPLMAVPAVLATRLQEGQAPPLAHFKAESR